MGKGYSKLIIIIINMKKSSCILLMLAAVATISQSKYLGKNENGVDRFTIDISQDPKYRYKEPCEFYKNGVRKVVENYLSLVPDFLLDLITKGGRLIHWINPEYYEEVDGMAYYLEMDTGVMMFMQYIYEFSAFCTSVVARMKDGTIIHDRNQDYAFAPEMRNITYEAIFYDGDKYLFHSTGFAGYNGIMTGMK